MDSSSLASVLPGSSDDRIVGGYGGNGYEGPDGEDVLEEGSVDCEAMERRERIRSSRRDGTYDATRSYREKKGYVDFSSNPFRENAWLRDRGVRALARADSRAVYEGAGCTLLVSFRLVLAVVLVFVSLLGCFTLRSFFRVPRLSALGAAVVEDRSVLRGDIVSVINGKVGFLFSKSSSTSC